MHTTTKYRRINLVFIYSLKIYFIMIVDVWISRNLKHYSFTPDILSPHIGQGSPVVV